jgi:Ca2+-binding RTX toxin-like protein
MSILTFIAGRPSHDWEAILQAVLENGAFSPQGSAGATLTLSFGSLQLVVTGANLLATGNRTVTSGTISGISLIDNGQTVLTMSGLALPAFANLQSMLDDAVGVDPHSEAFKTAITPFFMNEAVNATGSADGDTFLGSSGVDAFNGGGGDDYARGGAGVDTLDGGTGDDGLDYLFDARTVGININLAANSVVDNDIGAAIVDNISGFEQVLATNFADYIVGSAADNLLRGGGGADTIYGGAGNDDLRGDEAGAANAGDDQIYGGDGDDGFKGGAGQDLMDGGNGFDWVDYDSETIFAGDTATHGVIVNLSNAQLTGVSVTGIALTNVAAHTAIDTRNFIDTLALIEGLGGTGYDDILAGDDAGSAFEGYGGNDIFYGGAGADEINAGAGNDTLYGGEGGDFLFGGAGDDTIHASDSGLNRHGDFIMAGSGSNTIIGTAVFGSDGRRDGHNLSFQDIQSGVTANLTTGLATAVGMQTLFNEVHYLVGSGFGDSLTGGNAAFDDFEGYVGGAGNDSINGGSGFDEINYTLEAENGYFNASSLRILGFQGVNVNLGTGLATDSYGNSDTLSGIESIVGTGFGDTLTGSVGDNQLSGKGGNDFLYGGGGNDLLDGGLGNDRIDGGLGVDTIDYSAAGSALYIDLRVATQANTGGLGTDVITTIENVIGGAFADVLIGAAGADTLYGGAGADALVSVAGDDFAYGGLGDDYLAGRDGNDTLFGDDNNDVIDGGAGIDILRGNAGVDYIIGGTENDVIYGGDGAGNAGDLGDQWLGGDAGDDIIFGNLGTDRLSGGIGNDVLTGGEGYDYLTGEAGVDTFVYNAVSDGSISEQIGDWQGGVDKLRIDASAFGGGLAAGALAANQLVMGTVANQAFGQFLYNAGNGVLYWDADGTGAGAAVAFTRLFTSAFTLPPAALAAADFDIVA